MNSAYFRINFIFRAIFFLAFVFLSKEQNQSLVKNTLSTSRHDIDLLQQHDVNHIWTVDQRYFNVKSRKTYVIYSPTFSANRGDGIEWRLKFDLYTDEAGVKKFNFVITLSSDCEKPNVWITQGEVDFWSDENRTVSLWHDSFTNDTKTMLEFERHGYGWYWCFCNNTQIDTFFSKNKLIVSCNFKYCADAPALSYLRQTTTTTYQPSTPNNESFISSTSWSNSSAFVAVFPLQEVDFIWTVDRMNFSTSFDIDSPIFPVTTNSDYKFHLKLYPHETDNSNKFSLYLMLNSDSKRTWGYLALAIDLNIWSDEQKKVSIWHRAFPSELKYIQVNTCWGINDIPKNNSLLFSDNKLRKNITISCNVKYSRNISFVAHPRPNPITQQQNSFTLLFNASTYPDIVLFVNETQYPAHKAVLAARSPVFAAKFECKVKKGKKLKRLNITDMNERVAGEMLRYIYTGKCENLPQIADQLLVAADKYGLNDLKTICAESMGKNLTVENAAKTLEFADKHLVADLKAKTIAFIAAQYAAVSNTTDWQKILKKNPEFYRDLWQHANLLLNKGKW